MDGHIFIDGIISSDYHLEVKRQIEALGNNVDTLIVHIQSPGGSVYAGYNTYNVLKSSGKKIKAIIEGEAQSMATFISLAADKGQIEIKRPSTYMIHNPSQGLEGDADALSNGVDELRKIEAEMADAYSQRTKLPIDQIKAMMKKETRMNAEEAVKMGFADTIHDQLKAVAFGKHMTDNDKNLFEQTISKIEGLFKKHFPAASAGPAAMDLALKAGGMMNIMSENGDLVEKPATINGQPAPDGPHELADGRIIVTAGGVVKEVKESETPEQLEIKQLKAQLTALQAEKDAAIAAQTAAQTQVAQVNTAMEAIKTEVVALKKLTVGDPNPAGKGKIQDPTMKDEQNEVYRALQKEILEKAGILNN